MKLPANLEHIAIIMDGNGRWATERGYLRSMGHRAGAKTFSHILEACVELTLPILTVYAFSKENWKRSSKEVQNLFSLFVRFIKKELHTIIAHDIQLRFLGDTEGLPFSVQDAMCDAVQKTQNASGLICNIAFNYSAQEEILNACKQILNKGIAGKDITLDTLKSHLYTKELKEPDLLIRTGGEYRLSNFLLFQSAYTELYFTPILWPDFTKKQLYEAIEAFAGRKRKFGS